MYYIGIDTSCYTTSVAVIDEKENLIEDKRIMLKVKPGNRGIRQSEAFYQHINNLDILLKDIFCSIKSSQIKSIGISSKPRNYKDSYMPVFNSGIHIGNIIKHITNIPVFHLSHQENHIFAGLWSKKIYPDKHLAAYHISGGTTELLNIVINDKNMDIEIVGGSSDLKAGQFIDRVGVSMGLKFPCGKEMDILSKTISNSDINIPISVKGGYASFSGPETYAQRLLKDGQYDLANISHAIFVAIAKTLEKTLINSQKKFNWNKVLFIGGVSSNSIIKEYLTNSYKLKKYNIECIFAESSFAVDNAVGGAVYAKKCFKGC